MITCILLQNFSALVLALVPTTHASKQKQSLKLHTQNLDLSEKVGGKRTSLMTTFEIWISF